MDGFEEIEGKKERTSGNFFSPGEDRKGCLFIPRREKKERKKRKKKVRTAKG